MKKSVEIVLSIIMVCLFMVITISASEPNRYVFDYNDDNDICVTVSFDLDCTFSELKKQEIADSFGTAQNNTKPDSPKNIICSIFGHDLSTSAVSVIQHRVTIWNPRCLLSIYDVTGCSKCDYIEQVLVGSPMHITCCPENLPLPEGTNPTE